MARKRNIEYFPQLDALRGIAATTIAIYHFSPTWGGYISVDFFFILSGFVICHVYFVNQPDISLSQFIWYRLVRLYPLHIFCLLVFIATWHLLNNRFPDSADGTVFTLFQNLTLTNNIGLNPSGLTYNYPSWSVSVEFWVNILCFSLVFVKKRRWIILPISISIYFIIYKKTGYLETQARNYFSVMNSGLLRGLAGFLLGVVTYNIYLIVDSKRESFPVSFYSWAEIASTAGVLAVLFLRAGKLSPIDFLAPPIFMMVMILFSVERGVISKNISFLNFLGKISYSIYLNQVIILLIVSRYSPFDNNYATCFLFLVSLFLYSSLTYFFIEQPMRRGGRRFTLLSSSRA